MHLNDQSIYIKRLSDTFAAFNKTEQIKTNYGHGGEIPFRTQMEQKKQVFIMDDFRTMQY